MGNFRVWLFRGLVIIAAGLMLLSWFLPWWSCDVEALNVKDAVVIHPYGLDIVIHIFSYVSWASTVMPGFFAPLMWTYLGLAIAALLIGAWIKDKSIGLLGRKFNLSKLLIGVVGFSYIVVVIVAVIVITVNARSGGLTNPLGRTFIVVGLTESTWVSARLLFGYWLACGVGPLLIVLALLRDRIIGKAKLITR